MKQNYNLTWLYAQTKGNRRYLVSLALSGILMAVVNMGVATILKSFVDIATGDSATTLSANIIAAIGLLLMEGVLCLVIAMSFRVSCAKIARKIRLELADRLYHSSLPEMQEHHTGEYMTNLTEDVEKVSACFPTLMRSIVSNGLSAVLAILYLFWLNWKLALLLLICIPLLIFCIAIFSPIVQKTSRTDKENEERIRVCLQEMIEKIALFKIGFMWKKLECKASGLMEEKVKSSRRLGAAEGGSSFLNNIMGTAMFLIAMGGGAYFVMRGELLVGAMIAVIQLSNYIIWPFTAIGEIISNVNQAIVSAGRLDRVYALTQEPEQETFSQKTVSRLRLRGVSFCYKDNRILEGIDAEFEKRQIVGIVGESGGGKSTLLKVLSGLYHPEAGTLSVDFADGTVGEDVRPYVGLVPPADLVFSDTIGANICMTMEADRKRLADCAELANIGRYIEGLERQYDTEIGNGKIALSSGQEQRIGIARALYQKAEILLFDEPTANLDAESIAVFLDTLDRIAPERICIVVTHDPRVVARCSKVYEMKEGRLWPAQTNN
ncbi:MAG: ABC transporter ATP-binding protein/permease [Roseburia sp.]|nr:ABC transporter ATP-binding protein/permease [Roseburia sp.]